MGKKISINAGNALLLNEQSEVLSEYGSIKVNAGNILASRKAYDKLISMGASLNSGNMSILDISGDIVELAGRTVITADMSFDGCYIICDGKLVVEDANGLLGITGLYAKELLHPQSVDLSAIKGITALKRTAYPDDAKLHLGDMTLSDDSHIVLTGGLYWVSGEITALDEEALMKLQSKGTSFQCRKLIIYSSLYEKYNNMLKANSYLFIPDEHAVVSDITLDAATSVLHGKKLYVLGDLMIPHNRTEHLNSFSSLIVKGTVTMPVTAAEDFKACGKADDYELYEGVLLSINGKDTIGHSQLQSALEKGIVYTLDINGIVTFLDDITADDVEAIAAINCNGKIYASGNARGVLDSKIRRMNGIITDLEQDKKLEDKADQEDKDSVTINAGTYRL